MKTKYFINGEEFKGEVGCYMVSMEGDLIGEPDYSAIKNLVWYKRLLCKISPKYKERFKTLLPLKFN